MPSDEAYFALLRWTSSQTSQHIELNHRMVVLKLRLGTKAKKAKIPNGQSIQCPLLNTQSILYFKKKYPQKQGLVHYYFAS